MYGALKLAAAAGTDSVAAAGRTNGEIDVTIVGEQTLDRGTREIVIGVE